MFFRSTNIPFYHVDGDKAPHQVLKECLEVILSIIIHVQEEDCTEPTLFTYNGHPTPVKTEEEDVRDRTHSEQQPPTTHKIQGRKRTLPASSLLYNHQREVQAVHARVTQ